MPGESGSEFLAADDTRHSVGSMIISFEAGVFAGCECSTCTLGGAEPPKMYTCGHPRVSTGKDTCSWTIEPTRGAPGRSVVHPIDDPVAHACFRGLRAPHVQIMTSIRTIVHVERLPTHIDPRKHPCRPQLGRRRLRTINQTIRTRPMTPAAASVRWSCVCRCLRRLQAPHVYSTSSYSSKWYTWNPRPRC